MLAYVHDLDIMIDSQSEASNFGGAHMNLFLEAVELSLQEKKKNVKIDEAVEANLYRLGDYWLSLHSRFYRFLSPLGEELMLDELLLMGEEIGRKIHQAALRVVTIPEILSRSWEIDPSFFYTYRVLLAPR